MAFSRTLAVLVAASALVAACGHHAAQPPSSSTVSKPTAAPAPPMCGDPTTLPPRDKLAQLLMVGVRDAADAKAVVTTYHVGGIMIGSKTDLSMLTNGGLGEVGGGGGPLPLSVSVDEEGGRVSRLKSLIGTSPSARQLAQTQTVDQVYSLALDRGHQMKDYGITIDFAPVVDVTDAADDTVIGDRSFSGDPNKVTAYAGAYARGLPAAGLLPVRNPFPGHGHASGDSHSNVATSRPLNVF